MVRSDCLRAKTTMNISEKKKKTEQKKEWCHGCFFLLLLNHNWKYVNTSWIYTHFSKVPHVCTGKAQKDSIKLWTVMAVMHFDLLSQPKVNSRYNYLLFSLPQIVYITTINTCAASRTWSLTGVNTNWTFKVPLKSSRRTVAAGWTELHHVVQLCHHSNHIIPATLPLVLLSVFDTDT